MDEKLSIRFIKGTIERTLDIETMQDILRARILVNGKHYMYIFTAGERFRISEGSVQQIRAIMQQGSRKKKVTGTLNDL